MKNKKINSTVKISILLIFIFLMLIGCNNPSKLGGDKNGETIVTIPADEPTKIPEPVVNDNTNVDDYISTLHSDNLYAEAGYANGVTYDLIR